MMTISLDKMTLNTQFVDVELKDDHVELDVNGFPPLKIPLNQYGLPEFSADDHRILSPYLRETVTKIVIANGSWQVIFSSDSRCIHYYAKANRNNSTIILCEHCFQHMQADMMGEERHEWL